MEPLLDLIARPEDCADKVFIAGAGFSLSIAALLPAARAKWMIAGTGGAISSLYRLLAKLLSAVYQGRSRLSTTPAEPAF